MIINDRLIGFSSGQLGSKVHLSFYMLVSQGCCNKVPHTGWNKITEVYYLMAVVATSQDDGRDIRAFSEGSMGGGSFLAAS
jgi:hypothetical protein